MLNDLFYAVLGMLPWTCALIAALLVLRHFARAALSARFFRLAWLSLNAAGNQHGTHAST